jgi:enoyl-CoA hydratase
MDYKNIIFEKKELIGIITFNRPKALNALNRELLSEFSDALDKIANDDIKVLILTGSGNKAFVAGADIAELAKCDALLGKIFAEEGQIVLDKLQKLPIPVIAAVNGYALGGGSEVALAADFIYASDNAMFGLPEISLGLIPGFGGTQRLSRLIGKNMAKEMIFTGKMILAAEAKELGIVNKITAQDALMDETFKTAKLIASKGRVSLRSAKESVNYGTETDLKTGCKYEIQAFAMCMASEDSKEGTSAFLEKRKADFKGTLNG